MQKIINFRAFLIIFIGAIVGVVFSLYILQKNTFAFVCAGILTLGLLLFFVLTKILSKNQKLLFVNKFIICFLIGFFTFLLLGIANYKIFVKNIEEKQDVMISARVSMVSERGGYYYCLLENCTLNETEKVDGKIGFTLYSNDEVFNINVGDNLNICANLVANNLIKDGKFNSYYYKNDLKYYCYASKNEVVVNSGKMHFDEICRQKVEDMLFENLSYDNAAIVFASIFGDKTVIDENIREAFSISGTAHLLCVSGLHVGFLGLVIYFVLNLLKVKKKYSFLVLTIILCFYCYLCGFSPSVVRASIMSMLFSLCDAFGKFRYDSLSSISFAGILILLFKPFYVYDVGFQLSFLACFGIILLCPIFTKFFKKINFNNKISSAFCVTLSAQLGTFPILFHNFDKLSFLSVIANIVIVPIFSLIFMLSIVFVIINLILPFGFLFKIIDLMLNFVVFLTKGFGAVSACVFETFASPLLSSGLFYFILILLSGVVNLKIKTKLVSALSLVLVLLISVLLQFCPQQFKSNLIINLQSENFTIITNSFNEKALINNGNFDKNDINLIKKDMFNLKIFDIDILIMPFYSQEIQNEVSEICNDYSIKNLYIPQNENNEDVKFLFDKLNKTKIIFSSDEGQAYSNFAFKINKQTKSVYFCVFCEEENFSLFLCNKFNKQVSKFVEENGISADYIKTEIVDKKYSDSLTLFDNILCYKTNLKQINVFDINKLCDKIVMGEKLTYAF